MKHKVTCAALAAVVALGTGAEAQETAGGMMMDRTISRFDLGIYAGGSVTSDWFQSRVVRVENGTTTDVGEGESYRPGYAPVFGLTATYWVNPVIGLRAHGAYAPMRSPFLGDGFFDVRGDEIGNRSRYTINTYLYDLSLALRPFVANDARWLNGVYLWAGGGGVTANVAGQIGPNNLGCEPGAVALGACLPYDVNHATVGQGTAGAGMDFLPLSNSLSLFGELGFHVYDSPVHVGDGWLGVPRVPSGGTVRIADDRTAVTTRLVIGLKARLGNQIPYVAPVPLPPVVQPLPPQPAPVDDVRTINVCVVQGGMLREVQAQYNVTRGDTMVAGQRFSTAYPATAGYAAGATWYINSDVIMVNGQRYVKFGLPRVLGVNDVTRTTDYMGVPVFAESGATATPDIIYVPVRPGCEFQPYQREQKTLQVRG